MKRQDRGPSRRERRKATKDRPAPHNCDDTRKLRAITELLSGLAAGGHQHVLIGRVMETIDPAWHQMTEPAAGADPLTGALWAGPPGSSPPG